MRLYREFGNGRFLSIANDMFWMKGERDPSNPIRELPQELKEMSNTVKHIKIENCENLGQDRNGIASLFTKDYPELKELELINCGIEYIPESLDKTLPENLEGEFILQKLYLYQNNLTRESRINILKLIIYRRTLDDYEFLVAMNFPFQEEPVYIMNPEAVMLHVNDIRLQEKYTLDYLSGKINDQYTATLKTLDKKGLPKDVVNKITKYTSYPHGIGGKKKNTRKKMRKNIKKTHKSK